MQIASTQPKDRRQRVLRAFTLTEMLVALTIVSIMAVCLYAGITSGFFTVRMARENLRATQIMMEKVEVIRLCTWEQINSNNFIPSTFTAYYYNGTNNGGTNGLVYEGTIDIRQPPGGLMKANYTKDVRVIMIELKWKTGGLERTRQLHTYYSRWGLQNYVIN